HGRVLDGAGVPGAGQLAGVADSLARRVVPVERDVEFPVGVDDQRPGGGKKPGQRVAFPSLFSYLVGRAHRSYSSVMRPCWRAAAMAAVARASGLMVARRWPPIWSRSMAWSARS